MFETMSEPHILGHVKNIQKKKKKILKKKKYTHLVMAVRRDETDGGHQLDGLEHDEGHGGGDGAGQQRQRLLVVKQVLETNLVVHDRFQTLDALQLHPVPLGVTRTKNDIKD